MRTLSLQDYPIKTYDKVRYHDTDRQGHVNNAVFASFLETGRVEFLYLKEWGIITDETSFVIASLHLDFLQEITWPGQVEIGTGILKVGNSSIHLVQGIFQAGKCVAEAQTVIVQVDNESRKGRPLSKTARQQLSQLFVDKESE